MGGRIECLLYVITWHTANWPNSSEPPQNKIFPVHSSSKTMAAYAKNRLPCKIWASKSAAPARYRAFCGKINYHFFAWFGLADQKFDTKNQFLVESRPKKKKTLPKNMSYDQSYAQKTNFSHFSFFFQFWVSLLSISIIQHLCKTTRHSAFLGGARPKQLVLLWIGIVRSYNNTW